MTRTDVTVSLLILATLAGAHAQAADPTPESWPQFRGPSARGVADGHALPLRWNAAEDSGILWKTAIPGLAHSSPIVHGDAIFVTTAVSGKSDPELKVGLYGDIDPVEDDTTHRLLIYRLDRRTGKIVWQRTAFEGKPAIQRHTKSTHANPTPATDGRHVVAFFGSEGLHAWDMDGKPLWQRDFGTLDSGFFRVPEAQWGFASSPVIHDGRVIVQCDVQQDSFVAALDVESGEPLWRTARDDVPTWSTPTVHVGQGRAQVVLNGYRHIGGYDLATGKELWRMRGGGDIPVPTPYVAEGLIFLTSAHGGGSPIYAVRPAASGDVTPEAGTTSGPHVAWSVEKGGSYIPTTVVYEGLLYVLKDNGVLAVYDARRGERHYQQRLGTGSSGFSASAVAGDGKVYFTSELGQVYVVRAGTEFELLATNEMDEVVMATPAIAGGTLYFRTQRHLVAVGGGEPGRAPAGVGPGGPMR
jgi:outer membrane protein assembly factor BamB